MNLSLILVGALGVMLLASLTAYRMENRWRENAERELASCRVQLAGLSAAVDAARAAAASPDPAAELLRRFGR